VSQPLDIEYLLQEVRHEYVYDGAERNGRDLEEIMLTTEKNLRLMEAEELRMFANYYQQRKAL